MSLVLVGEEVLAVVDKLVTLPLAVVLKNPSGLKESLVGVLVHSGEPLSQLGILSRVGVDLVESVDHAVHGFAVGESLEDSSELRSGTGDSWVGSELLSSVGTLVGNVLGVTLV